MTTTKHKAYAASSASLLTTELNSLTSGSNSSLSGALDNSSNLNLFIDVELVLAAQGSARSTGAYLALFMVQALDGTNYGDANEITAKLVAVFPLDAATTARRATVQDIPIPPGLVKFFVRNVTGQTLASSGSSINYRAHSIESA